MEQLRRRIALVTLPALFLTGCGTVKKFVGFVGKVYATVEVDKPELIALWGIAKGLADVALPALEDMDPTAAAAVIAAIAVVDDLIPKLDTMDADALSVAASTIQTKTNAVTLAAAPKISAIPN